MIIKLLTGFQYDTQNADDRRRLKAYIPSLRSRGRLNEIKHIVHQLEKARQLNPNERAILAKAKENLPKIKKQPANIQPPKLIKNPTLYPRSEYYTRFEGTTVFDMADPDYWGTYHRSQQTRFFDIAGGRDSVRFMSDFLDQKIRANSFHAHTGGIASPFSKKKYRQQIKLRRQVPLNQVNVRDAMLLYKRKMANTVVESFKGFTKKNTLKVLKKRCTKSFIVRPIVYYENQYPCVMVKLPLLSPAEMNNEAAAYWSKHPKAMQGLLLASFIAFLNVEAISAGIPIETVIRASFGHNLPSVSVTDNTFRINVGIIPKRYAVLMGKALYRLNQACAQLSDDDAIAAPFKNDFFASVRRYNAKKLKNAIDTKARYKSLRGTRVYQKAAESDVAFKKLYQAFRKCNEGKPSKGRAHFVPLTLRHLNVWKVIRSPGDSKGRPLLAECFRKHEAVDWFANEMMKAILDENEHRPAIEVALYRLLSKLNISDTVTMNYTRIRRDLKQNKRSFDCLSFQTLYQQDQDFDTITQLLFKALNAKRPAGALYAELEKATVEFSQVYRGSDELDASDDFGSESEFSEEMSAENSEDPPIYFTHEKRRLCSGMKAIVSAQYAALSYLKAHNVKAYKQDVEQMYYEVVDALKLIKGKKPVANKVRANIHDAILHYDLNHCNAENAADNLSLTRKLKQIKPSVVILDYTSATYAEVERAMKQCLSQDKVELVILVESGLKNSQAGGDFNPYGEIRLIARDQDTRDSVAAKLDEGLAEEDKLPVQTHEMVRAHKRRGTAFSLFGFFRYRDTEEPNRFSTPRPGN